MFCQKKFIVKDNICHLDACKTVRFGWSINAPHS
jgi:hypothetical protein